MTALGFSVGVAGVSDVLRELGRIDPELRKQAVSSIRDSLQPLADAAKTYVPTDVPLSGMVRGTKAWNSGRVRSGIRAKVSTKANRSGQIPLAKIVQANPAGAMWDMAGKRGGSTEAGRRMIAVMSQRNGPPSRAMWRPVDLYRARTEEALQAAVDEVERTLNERLRGD